jgi:phosphoglucomutase
VKPSERHPTAGQLPDPASLVDIGGLLGALSEPAYRTTLEVLAGHRVDVFIDAASGYTPTPVISHAILTHNRRKRDRVLTPSHNPPEEGGITYNPSGLSCAERRAA